MTPSNRVIQHHYGNIVGLKRSGASNLDIEEAWIKAEKDGINRDSLQAVMIAVDRLRKRPE